MSKEEVKTETVPEPSETESQPIKKSKLVKLAILGFVAAVIGVECGAAYWFLASTGNAAEQAIETADAKAEGKSAGKSELKAAKHETKGETKGAAEKETSGDKDPAEQIEVVLGEFSVDHVSARHE